MKWEMRNYFIWLIHNLAVCGVIHRSPWFTFESHPTCLNVYMHFAFNWLVTLNVTPMYVSITQNIFSIDRSIDLSIERERERVMDAWLWDQGKSRVMMRVRGMFGSGFHDIQTERKWKFVWLDMTRYPNYI